LNLEFSAYTLFGFDHILRYVYSGVLLMERSVSAGVLDNFLN
jgi:hypothetical protein